MNGGIYYSVFRSNKAGGDVSDTVLIKVTSNAFGKNMIKNDQSLTLQEAIGFWKLGPHVIQYFGGKNGLIGLSNKECMRRLTGWTIDEEKLNKSKKIFNH